MQSMKLEEAKITEHNTHHLIMLGLLSHLLATLTGRQLNSKSYERHYLVTSGLLHPRNNNQQVSNSPLGPTPYTIW